MKVKKLREILLDSVLPEACLMCGRSLLGRRSGCYPVCRDCRDGLQFLEGERCSRCGRPLLSEIEVCLGCRDRSPAVLAHRSLLAYDYRSAELLRAFKAGGTQSLAALFGPRLLGLQRQLCPASALVPVPGHPTARRKRGWDQALLLCQAMRRAAVAASASGRSCGAHPTPIPQVWPILQRGRSRRQKELSYAERQTNLQGRIQLLPARPPQLVGASVTLVDDVYTTGATLNACCEALVHAGVSRVFAVTIAMDL